MRCTSDVANFVSTNPCTHPYACKCCMTLQELSNSHCLALFGKDTGKYSNSASTKYQILNIVNLMNIK